MTYDAASAAVPGLLPSEFGPLADAEFQLFQGLIYREAGISLTDEKRELLVARLTRRLRALGLRSFGVYYRRVKKDAEERMRMLDCITTNETHFFREPHQFDFLREVVLPAWEEAGNSGGRPRRIRAWCAGCSTGEEPYSLAMTLLHHLPGWAVEILATDLSTRVLDVARAGMWSVDKAKEIPSPYLKRYMLKGRRGQQNKMKAGVEIRSVIEFRRLNLNDEDYPLRGRFDLIFCRNVMIYFSAESRMRVIRRLLGRLEPWGYFFVGHAESLGGVAGVHNAIPTVYSLRSDTAPPGPGARAIAEASNR